MLRSCKTTTGKCLWSNWLIRSLNPFRWLVCLNAHWHPVGACSKQLSDLMQCHCSLWTKSSLRCDSLNCNSNTCCSGSDKTTTLHKFLFASTNRRQNTIFPPRKKVYIITHQLTSFHISWVSWPSPAPPSVSGWHSSLPQSHHRCAGSLADTDSRWSPQSPWQPG